ncbi:hypothetical protein IMX07_02490 [bacterium]|nr:hypothetical protein [bacterium]
MDAILIPQVALDDFWGGTTDVPCSCGGLIRWAEAGYVPGARACDRCLVLYAVRGRGADRRLVPQTSSADHIDDADETVDRDGLYRVPDDYFRREL